MDFHANHALGLPQRLALVKAIESGMTQKAAAAAFCVAPATAHRWWHRHLDAGAEEVRAAGPLLTAPPQPTAARCRHAGADLRVARAHRLGTATGRRQGRSSPLDRL